MAELTNRVAQSGLRNIDLEDLRPKNLLAEFDLKDYLFQGLVLREKDFREALEAHDWAQYAGKTLLVYCSTDAILPAWAPMLVASYALHLAEDVFAGDMMAYLEDHYRHAIQEMDISGLADSRVVVKGCSSSIVPPGAYLELVKRLQPVVKSLMFGEPCSTVPVYKKKG
jgi:hypothetical protein